MGANGHAGLRLHSIAVGCTFVRLAPGVLPGTVRGPVVPPPSSLHRPPRLVSWTAIRPTRRAPHRRGPVPQRTGTGVMSHNQIRISAPPEAVFDAPRRRQLVPRTGWSVPAGRPARGHRTGRQEGSEFHHALGVAGAELHDSTEVVEARAAPTDWCSRSASGRRAPPASNWSLDSHRQRGASSPWKSIPGLRAGQLAPALPDRSQRSTLRNAVSLQRLRHEVEQRANPGP